MSARKHHSNPSSSFHPGSRVQQSQARNAESQWIGTIPFDDKYSSRQTTPKASNGIGSIQSPTTYHTNQLSTIGEQQSKIGFTMPIEDFGQSRITTSTILDDMNQNQPYFMSATKKGNGLTKEQSTLEMVQNVLHTLSSEPLTMNPYYQSQTLQYLASILSSQLRLKAYMSEIEQDIHMHRQEGISHKDEEVSEQILQNYEILHLLLSKVAEANPSIHKHANDEEFDLEFEGALLRAKDSEIEFLREKLKEKEEEIMQVESSYEFIVSGLSETVSELAGRLNQ